VFTVSLGRAGVEDQIFDAAVEGEYVALGWGDEIDWTSFNSYEAIHARWNEDHPGTSGNDSNITQVWRFRCSMQPGDLVVVSYGNSRFRAIGEIVGPYEYAPANAYDYYHRRKVRWLYVPDEPLPVSFYAKPFTMRSCYMLRDAALSRETLALLLPSSGGAPVSPRQFVLICDEINCANISKVFGELITLLEADKRLGMPNALRLALPYSKITDFGVPANLHIIGIMNTADRSIALLDTALRRRFNFEELMPRPDLPESSCRRSITATSSSWTISARIKEPP
jgi:5-methylcytosine-specific restriction protein B